MCSDKYEQNQAPWGFVDMERHFDQLISAKLKTLERVMDEREKASIIAAQALIIKDGQDQLNKFVLKKELDDKITSIQEQLTGSLGLELRMRAQENQHGAISAQLYMVIIGLPLAVTVVITAITYLIMARITGR